MKDPQGFKKAAPSGNAPNVNDPLQNPLLRYVTGAECQPDKPATGYISITVRINPEKRLSAYQDDTVTLVQIIRKQLEFAEASAINIAPNTNADPADTNPNRTNQFLISVKGDLGKIQSVMDAVVAAGTRMATSSPSQPPV